MSMILVEMGGFTASYPVYYVDLDKETISPIGRIGLSNFGKLVVNYCNQYDCNLVNIKGESRFANNCAKEILTVAKNEYSQNNIKVEVNGNEIFN